MNQFILYTYLNTASGLVCHAYGPSENKAALQLTGENLQQSTAGLGFMVLPLEAVPV